MIELRMRYSSIIHLLLRSSLHSRIYRCIMRNLLVNAVSSPVFLIESKAGIRYSHLRHGIMARCFTPVAYIIPSKTRLHRETRSCRYQILYRRCSPRATALEIDPRRCWVSRKSNEEGGSRCITTKKHYTACSLNVSKIEIIFPYEANVEK